MRSQVLYRAAQDVLLYSDKLQKSFWPLSKQ